MMQQQQQQTDQWVLTSVQFNLLCLVLFILGLVAVNKNLSHTHCGSRSCCRCLFASEFGRSVQMSLRLHIIARI